MNASDTEDQPADQIPQADHAPEDETSQGPREYRPPFDYRGQAPLYRPYEGRMVAGVAASISQYLGVDPNIVRIVLAILTVAGGAGIPVYLAGWLLIPDEGAPQSLASEFISSFQSRSY